MGKRNRRRGTRPIERARHLAVAVTAGLIGPAVVAAIAIGAARWAAHHPYFELRDIEIEGARDPERILEWAAVTRGSSLWSIDPKATERRLLSAPRVRAASVRRDFPDRLTIRVEERQPIAVLLFDDPLLIDAEGQVFSPLRRELLEDFPYVTGFTAADLRERPAWASERLRLAMRILRMWQRHPDWPAVSEVRPESGGEFVVYPEQAKMAIRFGKEIDEEQFGRLSAVLDLWRGREAEVAGVDLTVPGQAVLQLRRDVGRDRRMTI